MRSGAKQAAGTCEKSWVKEVSKEINKAKKSFFLNLHFNVSSIFTLYSFLTGAM